MIAYKRVLCFLSLAPLTLFAEVLLQEDFETGIDSKVSKLESAEGTLKIVEKTANPLVAGADDNSAKALVFQEDGESYQASFKPAMDFPLADPGQNGVYTVSFSFRQVSGDASGLSVDLIQKTPSYGVWARIYLGKDLTKVMVSGSKANSSIIPGNISLSNGAESSWHHVVMKLKRSGGTASHSLKIDDHVIDPAPVFAFANPSQIQALRFSDEGSGPNAYMIDNLSVTWESPAL